MAIVYRAVQKSLERTVALKILNPLHSRTVEFTERFLNEGRIIASLEHSNVVTIHDIGVEGDLHYIAMEFLAGGDLRHRIRRGLTVSESLGVIETIASALGTAHARRVVHRDVKPANVLFRADETLVLSDFGIAKRLGNDDLTLAGSTIGSPHYLSPEQARGRAVDARADIYSLGIMLHEMLTGRKPFRGASDIDTVLMHVSDPMPRLPEHLAHLQPLVDRMTAKAPEDRFTDTAALIDALGEARAELRDTDTLPPDADDEEHAGTADVSFHSAVTVIDEHQEGAGTPATTDSTDSAADPGSAAVDFQDADTLVDLHAVTPRPARASRGSLALMATGALALLVLAGWWLEVFSPAPPAAMVEPPRAENTAATPADPVEATPAPAPATQVSAAPGEAPAPQPAENPEQTRVDALLASAERAMDEFRLTRPAGDNAWEYLREARALAPDHPGVRAGFDGIVERYVGLAKTSMAAGDDDRARGYVARGLDVDPGSRDLRALEQTLASRPASPPPPVEPARTETTPSGVKGETPKQLFNRIKGFFD